MDKFPNIEEDKTVMKATFTMWKNKQMIILVVVCAVIYAGVRAVLTIDFALLVPEIMGMGAANILPMLFGLLFGPAGAWGAAIGHLIGDLGALSWKSLFDFVGIFLLGYLPYAMWTTLKPIADGQRKPAISNWRSWMLFILIAFISSVASNVVVTAWLELLGFVPHTVLFAIIFFVSIFSVLGGLVGGILFLSLHGVIKNRLGLIWWDVMDERDIGKPLAGTIGAWLVIVGALVGVASIMAGFSGNHAGETVGIIGMIPIIIGCLLL